MILYIDTTDFNTLTYALKFQGRLVKKTYKIDPRRSYEILNKLEGFLKSARLKPSGIKEIITNKGPGSFTGTRIGVAHTRALAFALGARAKFLEKDKFAESLAK